MSIKNLFGKTVTNYEDVAKDVESTDFIDEVVAKRETYLPPIDFSDPANFVFYGSAELYYEAAIKRIYEDYPYDGSKAEQIDFEEKSSFLERWLFENKYPKTTGHVELGTTATLTAATGLYANTSTPEYIEVHGGLHISSTATNLDEHLEYSARYDEANNRTQNFNCDFTNKGIAIEFWMKKSSYTGTNKEVILDLWNGVARGAAGYSRVFLETFDDGTKKMALTIASGSTLDTSTFVMGTTETNWNHYALSVVDGTANATVRFYANGAEVSSDALSHNFATLPGRLDGFIGAMQTEIGSGQGAANGGKLSAQLDEFRFWKTRRTSRQIKLNWFREIGGGANTDDNTSDLGAYLKFNEGITGTNSIDSTVLDYSGRLANGTWVGYPGSSARSTDSAITSAGYTEAPTPIIYSTHPSVVSLEAEMTLSGSDYDAGRGEAFYRSLPNWLVEEDQEEGDENLRKISHILSSYMDTLKVQMDSLNRLQDKQYVSASYKATPFASELLRNKGFTTSEMFLSSEVFESFSSIDYGSGQFDLNIDEIKNLIYINIYNNLENIYNTKGTEKSIRNLIRCFGIDDELIKLNQYTDGGRQYLGDKYRSTSVKKKYVNLNNANHLSATMYQSGSLTFISGASDASVAAFTMEADIVVPHKPKLGENGYFATPFLSASVMGFHEAMPTNASNFTWWATETATSAAATGQIDHPASGWSVSNYEGQTVTLVSTDGTSITYEFSSTASNGDVLPNGNIAVAIGASLFDSIRNGLRNVINGSSGHNGKITASYTYELLTLVQATAGQNGNTIITTSAPATTMSPVNFAGGAGTFGESRDLQVYLVRDSLESEHAQFVLKNQSETIYVTSSFIHDIYDNDHYNVALRIKPQTYPYAGNVTNATPNYDIELYAVSHNFDELKEEILISTTVDNATGSAYMQAPKRIYAASHYENFTGSLLQRTDLEFGRVSAWLDYLPNSSIQEHNKDVMNYGNHKSIDGSTAFAINDIEIPTMDLSILNWDFDTVTTSDSSGEFVIEDTTSGSSDTIYGWVDNLIRREHDGKGDNFPTSSAAFLENEFLYASKKQLPETSFNTHNIYIKGEQEINFSEDDDVSDNLFILEKSPAAIVSEEMLKLFSTTQEFSNLFGRHVDRYRIEYKDLARARQLFHQRVGTGLDFDKFFAYFKWIDQSISEMVNQLIPASVNFSGGVVDVIEPHILERDKYQRQIGLLQTVTSTEASIRGVQELNYNWRIGHAPRPLDTTTNSIWQMERTGSELTTVITRQTDQEFTNPIKLSGSTAATALIITVPEASLNDTKDFTLTDAAGITTTYNISLGLAISNNTDAYTPGGEDGKGPAGTITIGMLGATPATDVRDQIITRINAGTSIGFTATTSGDNVLVTQNTLGSIGNTVITQPDGATGLTIPTEFTGGFGDAPGVYNGRTYATRRFSRPYRAKIEFADTIHGGTNYVKIKDRDLLRSGIGLHSEIASSGAPRNIVTIGAGTGQGLNVAEVLKTQDQRGPSEKIRYDGFGIFGKFTELNGAGYGPLSSNDEYTSRRKVCNVFLGNIVSSSVVTGYNETVSASFKPGVNIVNLHSDTTDISNEIAIQGPFTERWVGGHQHRHTALNSIGKPVTSGSSLNSLDSERSRPEGYRLLLGKNPLSTVDPENPPVDGDGALGFTAPDYGIGSDSNFPDDQRMYSIFYREERAKRPLNIKNIQTTTSSVYHGNYQHEYEVFSTFGDQGYFMKRAGNLLPEDISLTLPETTNFATLMAQKASAQGNIAVNEPGGAISNRFTSGSFATMTITTVTEATLTTSPNSHDNRFTLTDGEGATTTFLINVNGSSIQNSIAYSPGIETSLFFGGLTTRVEIRDALITKINKMNPARFTATADGDNVLVTQNIVGSVGNTGITFPDGAIAFTFSGTNSFQGGSFGVNDQPTQDRENTGSAHVIRTQFSAPGGPEINSPAYLDVANQEFSVYNSINFRNLSVLGSGSGGNDTIRVNSHSHRREGLRTLRSRHQGQFGIDSKHGSISAANYVAEASFHKQHRNTTKIAKGIGSGPVAVGAKIHITAVAEGPMSTDDTKRFSITDADGVTTTFTITGGGHSSNNNSSYSPGGTTNFSYVGLTTADTVRDSLILKINAGTGIGYTATAKGTNQLTLTQNKGGRSGHTTIEFPDGLLQMSFSVNATFFDGIDAPTKRRDNMHFNTPIPASDFQYSWINAAISGSNWEASQSVLTHAPRSGIISSSSGIDSAISFPTISDVSCCSDSVEFSVSYGAGDGAGTLTGDGSLEVVTGPGATSSQIIEGDSISGMDVTITSNGCCPSTEGFEYRVTAVNGDGSGTPYDSGYQSTEQGPPSGIVKDAGDAATVTITFFVKDCEGNITTLVVTLTKAKLT